MLYEMVLEMTRLKPFPVFTVSPDVTLYLISMEKERNQPGRPGMYMVFLALSSATVTITSNVMTVLERYVILLYDRTRGDIHIDQCRKHLFSSKGRSLEAKPPTKGALEQHIKRAAYQAGHIWSQSLIRLNLRLFRPEIGVGKKTLATNGHHFGHFYHR